MCVCAFALCVSGACASVTTHRLSKCILILRCCFVYLIVCRVSVSLSWQMKSTEAELINQCDSCTFLSWCILGSLRTHNQTKLDRELGLCQYLYIHWRLVFNRGSIASSLNTHTHTHILFVFTPVQTPTSIRRRFFVCLSNHLFFFWRAHVSASLSCKLQLFNRWLKERCLDAFACFLPALEIIIDHMSLISPEMCLILSNSTAV